MSNASGLADRVPEVDYTRYTNRQLAAVPLGVLAVALVILAGWYVTTGVPVALGIEFTGGTEAQIQTSASQAEIEQSLSGLNPEIQPVRGSNEYIVTTQETGDTVETQLDEQGYEVRSISETAPTFGASQVQWAGIGLLIAFLGMSALIFLLFRSFVPSIAVIASAFSDIVIPLALMNVFGIDLSLGTVAALLMLIGYSVDSDVLLNNHILRRRGDFYESAYAAMRTGVTMTVTSIAAMSVMTVTAWLLQIPLMPDIGIILVFGLSADLMNTYMLNMSLLRWYKYEGVAR